MPKKHPFQGILIISVLGVLIGGGMIYRTWNKLQRQRASLTWPVTPGVVQRAESIIRYHRRSKSTRAEIAYNYVVNGTKHTSYQISLWSADLASHDGAESFIAIHPAQSAVNVYYNPQYPDQAVLIPGAHEGESWLVIAAGGVLASLCSFGIVAHFKRMQKLRKLNLNNSAKPRTFTFTCTAVDAARNAVLLSCAGIAALSILAFAVFKGFEPLTVEQWLTAFAILGGIGVFGWMAKRKMREMQCPICDEDLNTNIVQCPGCGTHFVFKGRRKKKSRRR